MPGTIRSSAHGGKDGRRFSWPIAAVLLVAMATQPAASIVVRDDADGHVQAKRASPYASLLAWLHVRDGEGLVLAEGTLIDPEWVLTAAHAVDELAPGSHAMVQDSEHRIALVCIHPDWTGVFEELNDIALLRLDRPAPRFPGVELSRSDVLPGQAVVLVGRGMSGDGRTGPRHDERRLLAATNRVTESGPLHIAFTFDPPASDASTELEGVSGPGDSGGPLFLDQPGVPVLVGVSSAQDDAPTGGRAGTYGVIEYYTRVAGFTDWIDSVRRAPGESGCRSPVKDDRIDAPEAGRAR